MKSILLLSDTHSCFDGFIEKHIAMEDTHEVWHAGDIGNTEWLEKYNQTTNKPLRAVYGNIDDAKVRLQCSEILKFEIENSRFFMTHIAGSFSNLKPKVKTDVIEFKPKVLICGHSHILKVQYNAQFAYLYMNPGAAGIHGFHKHRTMLKFDIINQSLTNLRVIQVDKKIKPD